MAGKKSMKITKRGGSGERSNSIMKKPTKTLSKKKQRALTKSTKVMIEKMNTHTTEDDISNIIKTIETHADTKAVSGNEAEESSNGSSLTKGLESLKTQKLRMDKAKDEITHEMEKAIQTDIAEQLKMINDFSL